MASSCMLPGAGHLNCTIEHLRVTTVAVDGVVRSLLVCQGHYNYLRGVVTQETQNEVPVPVPPKVPTKTSAAPRGLTHCRIEDGHEGVLVPWRAVHQELLQLQESGEVEGVPLTGKLPVHLVLFYQNWKAEQLQTSK